MLNRVLLKSLQILWASPWTLLGLLIAIICSPLSVKFIFYHGTVGCYGRGVALVLRRMPIAGGARAMTLGHTIWACDRLAFISTHPHELVHVRQYERWGPFFVPAYLICGVWLWWNSNEPYWDNPFEKEAYRLESEYQNRNIA